MKNKIVLLAMILFYYEPLIAQWGFTAAFTYSGDCYGLSHTSLTTPFNGFATRNQCETFRTLLKNQWESIAKTLSGLRNTGNFNCNINFSCTSCNGSDIELVQGRELIISTEGGKTFFTPNHGQEVEQWIKDVQYKFNILNLKRISADQFIFPKTGIPEFDNIYANLFQKEVSENSVITKRMGRNNEIILKENIKGENEELNPYNLYTKPPEISDGFHYTNWPVKQDPNALYFILPHEKEEGIKLANELLSLAEQRLNNFENNMSKIEDEKEKLLAKVNVLDNEIVEAKKQVDINEYKKQIILHRGDESLYSVTKDDLKLYGIDEQTINSYREDVIDRIVKVDPDAIFDFMEPNGINRGIATTSKAAKKLKPIQENLSGIAKHKDHGEYPLEISKSIQMGIIEKEYSMSAEEAQKICNNWKKQKQKTKDSIKELGNSKKRLIAEKEDIIKAKKYFSNVIKNGNIESDETNYIDVLNLGQVLNTVINKKK